MRRVININMKNLQLQTAFIAVDTVKNDYDVPADNAECEANSADPPETCLISNQKPRRQRTHFTSHQVLELIPLNLQCIKNLFLWMSWMSLLFGNHDNNNNDNKNNNDINDNNNNSNNNNNSDMLKK